MTLHPYGWKRGTEAGTTHPGERSEPEASEASAKAATAASPERSEAGGPRPRSKAQEAKKNGPHPSGVRAGAPAAPSWAAVGSWRSFVRLR